MRDRCIHRQDKARHPACFEANKLKKEKPIVIPNGYDVQMNGGHKVLVIGDIHAPVDHPMYLPFCKDIKKRLKCDTVVFIGDVVDWHGISFHAKHPGCPGPSDEYELAKEQVGKWYKAFPKAYVCIGNHDERPERLAQTVSIPAEMLKTYADIWETPGWIWGHDFVIDHVYYFHGTGRSGLHPAYNAMKSMLMSVCMGHIHTAAGIKWLANPEQRTFGLDVSCGIDVKAYQFAYGKHMKQRPILGAGAVLNGVPQYFIMTCGKGERWSK